MHANWRDWDHADSRDVDCLSGACMMLPRALAERLSGFDEAPASMYGEDLDLCCRIRRVGLRHCITWHNRAHLPPRGAASGLRGRSFAPLRQRAANYYVLRKNFGRGAAWGYRGGGHAGLGPPAWPAPVPRRRCGPGGARRTRMRCLHFGPPCRSAVVVRRPEGRVVEVKRILLLGAGFGTGNLGVSAGATGALKVILTRLPGTTVHLLDYGREPVTSTVRIDGHARPVTLVNLRSSWKLLLPNNAATLLVLALSSRPCGSALRRWLEARNPWLRSMAEADLAAAVSGGDSFSDIYGRGRFFYVALPQLLCAGDGPAAGAAAADARPVPPRQHASRRRASSCAARRWSTPAMPPAWRKSAHLLGPRRTARALLPRPGLRARGAGATPRGPVAPPRACGDEGRPRVGVNVSGLLLMGGYTRGNEVLRSKLDYGEFVDRLITHMVEVKGADVMLVPHVFSDDAESDTQAARTVLERPATEVGRAPASGGGRLWSGRDQVHRGDVRILCRVAHARLHRGAVAGNSGRGRWPTATSSSACSTASVPGPWWPTRGTWTSMRRST